MADRSTPHKARQKDRLKSVESDITAGTLQLCFGSKKLWRAQNDLLANGYTDHAEWLTN